MSLYKLVILSLLFPSLFCYSQETRNQKKIDSLESRLSKETLTIDDKILVFRRLCDYLRFQNDVEHKRYLDSLISTTSKDNINKHKGIVARYKAGYYNSISEYDLAEKYYKEAVNEFYKTGELKLAHNNLRFLSKVQRKLGKLEDAMNSAMKAINEKDSLGIEGIDIARDYTRIGEIHGALNNIELSNSYFQKAENIYLKENKESSLAGIRQNMATNYLILMDYDKALMLFEQSIIYFEKANRHFSLASLYNSVGNIKLRQDSLSIARSYYDKALKISRAHNYPVKIANSKLNLGKVFLAQENYKKSLKYFKESLMGFKSAGTKSSIAYNYLMISRAYAGLNDYSSAYDFSKLHFKVYDSIFKQENIDKINKLEVQYQTAKKEAEIVIQSEKIKTLNQEVKISNLNKTLYGIGMFSFLAIAGLLYFGFKLRIKKNRITREKQEEIYKQEIAFKKKELASQTLHLVQKNTFIQELKGNLEKIKQSPELFKVEFRRLIMLLKKENAEDKDWEVFKSYFSEVHDNFDNKIKAIAHDVSEKEIRLASFLRMNLSTKEIASMLNVLPDSVLKSKYRLKKKLQLEKESDLTEFLNTL